MANSYIYNTIKELKEILNNDLSMNYESDICIDNSLLVVGDSALKDEFIKEAKDKFSIESVSYIDSFSGNLGSFNVKINEEILNTSQIVFFNKFDIYKPQLGITFANEYESRDSLILELENLIGEFSYENTILYSKDKCQYHHRDKNEFSYCKSCVEVCPNMSISSNDEKRELIFSNIDCILCGKCVAVCPSGAMEKTNTSLYNLNKAIKLYKNKIILICNNNNLEEEVDKILATSRKDILPLPLPNINMLNEVYLLSILQESANVCVISGNIESLLKESIDFINYLYIKLFNKKAIFSNIDDILKLSSTTLEHYSYEVDRDEFSREIFSNRLKYFIKDKNFGVIENTKSILYTNLTINQDICTLCMSCVESCNTKALINSKDNFSLLLNPSICTACGYCVDNCPEKCIEMPLQGVELKENFFTYNTIAKDEPFKCVECGKVFASMKSIAKVKSMIAPLFGNDNVRKRTLECCSDCKVKVMFKA
ncbi:4Fe-4S binding protein [Helicobacter sp. MIT 14-3879]|uniref:4Fe-4S binding protein n=1 Tax=Helicobacter sp. MIT 14-3879 TaxID=2040649 RepID=UPI000E1EAB70|nr:4Fe-4S binding protein [Helicobacter sp. MIT 14-3879]RDU64861.1 hypothetical protein CQA44_03905 [Helicobacter sp. MIT 14-3879]